MNGSLTNNSHDVRRIYWVEGKFTGNFGKSLTDCLKNLNLTASSCYKRVCVRGRYPSPAPSARLLKQLTAFQETLHGLNVNANSLAFMSFLPTATANVTVSHPQVRATADTIPSSKPPW